MWHLLKRKQFAGFKSGCSENRHYLSVMRVIGRMQAFLFKFPGRNDLLEETSGILRNL